MYTISYSWSQKLNTHSWNFQTMQEAWSKYKRTEAGKMKVHLYLEVYLSSQFFGFLTGCFGGFSHRFEQVFDGPTLRAFKVLGPSMNNSKYHLQYRYISNVMDINVKTPLDMWSSLHQNLQWLSLDTLWEEWRILAQWYSKLSRAGNNSQLTCRFLSLCHPQIKPFPLS